MDTLFKRTLINKKTKEAVISDVAYMFDCAERVYYIIDRIEIEEASTIVNVMFTLDEDYTPVGVVFNDRFESFSMLDSTLNVQEAYNVYKEHLIKKVIEDAAKKYDHFYDINDKFVKVRKKGTVHGNKGNGSN